MLHLRMKTFSGQIYSMLHYCILFNFYDLCSIKIDRMDSFPWISIIINCCHLGPQLSPFWFCAATIEVRRHVFFVCWCVCVCARVCVCFPSHPHRFISIEMKSVKFEDSLFEDCHFENIRSTDTVFENCTIRSTVFYNTGRFSWTVGLEESVNAGLRSNINLWNKANERLNPLWYVIKPPVPCVTNMSGLTYPSKYHGLILWPQ